MGYGDGRAATGLRERKKQAMRRQLSDTAARMFLERGFDAVRVAEVAAACGVSEKTVFNYFPNKEALILDRLDTTAMGCALNWPTSQCPRSPRCCGSWSRSYTPSPRPCLTTAMASRSR
jgi:hypothetical protein